MQGRRAVLTVRRVRRRMNRFSRGCARQRPRLAWHGGRGRCPSWPLATVTPPPPARSGRTCGRCERGPRGSGERAPRGVTRPLIPAACRSLPLSVAMPLVTITGELPDGIGGSPFPWEWMERAWRWAADGVRYARPAAPQEVVPSGDEKTALQPRTRRWRPWPARLDHSGWIAYEDERTGASDLLTAFDTRTRMVHARAAERKRQMEFIGLLTPLDREVRAGKTISASGSGTQDGVGALESEWKAQTHPFPWSTRSVVRVTAQGQRAGRVDFAPTGWGGVRRVDTRNGIQEVGHGGPDDEGPGTGHPAPDLRAQPSGTAGDERGV